MELVKELGNGYSIKKASLTEDILKKVMVIDDSFYLDTITPFSWYTERYSEYNEGLFLIKDNIGDKQPIGYIIAVPITETLYDAISDGVMVGDTQINPDMILKAEKSDYMYLVSCVVMEPYRRKGFGTELAKLALSRYNSYITCMTVSKGGYKLMDKLMEHKIDLPHGVSIFNRRFV